MFILQVMRLLCNFVYQQVVVLLVLLYYGREKYKGVFISQVLIRDMELVGVRY